VECGGCLLYTSTPEDLEFVRAIYDQMCIRDSAQTGLVSLRQLPVDADHGKIWRESALEKLFIIFLLRIDQIVFLRHRGPLECRR